jgi:uncharacterized protein with PQ loop repeat
VRLRPVRNVQTGEGIHHVSTVDVPVVAGAAATAVFAAGTLPMLIKAHRTKDVRSYSLGNIALANIGNVLYTLYVLHLPVGPVWALHAFHTISTGLMLFWYVRYAAVPRWTGRRSRVAPSTVSVRRQNVKRLTSDCRCSETSVRSDAA